MLKQAYQKPEIRDASDNIIQQGTYGKKTAFTASTNDGVLDYINNNLEAMMSLITGEMIYADTSAGFPSAGDTSKLYIAKDTGKMYTWDGTEYVERTGAINGVGITGITIDGNNNMVFAMTDGTTHTVTVPQVQAAIDAATSASSSATAAANSASSAASSATTAQTNQTVQDLGTLTANTTINGSLGETVKAVIGADLTLAINANAASGKVRRLSLVLSNGGKYVITWPTTITWAENYPPVLSYQTDMIELVTVNNGTSWYGRVVSRNMGAIVFSRASQAYLDGRLYAANVPRFMDDGLMIEEYTTNLIPSASAPSMSSAVTVTVTSGSVYTASCATGTVTLSGAGTGTVTNGNPVTITARSTSLTLTPTSTATNVQLEAKSYATSYINGTRAAESLTVPASVFSKDEGTLEFTISPKVIANWNNYFLVGGSWGRFLIYFNNGQAYWDYGNHTAGIGMNLGAVTANTSIKISLSWSALSKERIAVVNGVSYTSTGWSVSNGLTLPSTIWPVPVNNFSSDIKNIRFSHTAHSADKMIADQQLGQLPVESDTTYYMSLDRTLFAEGSAM